MSMGAPRTVWQLLAELYPLPDPREEAWRNDPAAWARDRLDAHLWSKQQEICTSVATNRRTAVKSCHGVGKSWTAGMLACWWIDTHPPGEAIVVTTAPTYKQVHAVLWQEIRKQHKRGNLPGRVKLDDEWLIDQDIVGLGRKPADHDEHGFQGIHRRYVLAILDEACGIPANLYTGVEAITTNADCRILAIGNPDDPNTQFGRICRPGSGWNIIRISALESPNFTGEPVPDSLTHLLPTPEWVQDAAANWGETSPVYTSKVLGDFPEVGDDTLIHPAWITAAQNADLPEAGPAALGVDVARFGADKTVLCLRKGQRYRITSTLTHSPTDQTAGHVIAAQRANGLPGAQVDGVGVGGGVVDLLNAYGAPVADMQAGGAPYGDDAHRFANARAQWYWSLRRAFELGEVDLDPTDDALAAQLGSIRYTYDARGRIKIESKDDMAKRGLPSPDRADALMLAHATPRPDGDYGTTFYDIG